MHCELGRKIFCLGHLSSLQSTPESSIFEFNGRNYLFKYFNFFFDFRTMEDRLERFEAKINLSFNRLSSKIDSQQASIDYLTTLIERLTQQVIF